jgi:DNA-binding transcriptional LysR family regulator
MHTMDWDEVRVFLAVARAGRISHAARALGVEHTTVGRRLAAFEAALGAQLFYKTAGGYRLTLQGESALGNAEAMERAALGLGARVRESAGAVAGRVRLALLDEVASHWLALHLVPFRERYPAIDLQVVTGIQALDLSRGEADLAIRTPRPRQPGLSALRLSKNATGLYAAREFLRGKRLRVTSADDARGLPLLLYLPEFHALQEAAWFQPVLAAARVVLRTNSTHTLLGAARAGAGLVVLPRLVARHYDELVSVSDDTASGDLWLVGHSESRRDPKLRATSEFLKRAASGPDGLI